MKKVWLMLAAALFCGSAGAAAPELFRPDEALLSHQLLTGALRAYETGSVVRLD